LDNSVIMARANRSIVNSKPKPFLSTWKTDNLSQTSSAANQIVLPLAVTGSYNFMVYWGDNTSSSISSALQPEVTHSYATAGTYNVTMSGYINGWSFFNGRDRRKITNISQWGSLKLGSSNAAFYGCDALTLNNISDTPNLYASGGASLSAMFRSCSLLVSISRANEWDTSQVTNMSQIFYTTYRYNQNIGNWNTSKTTTMSNMLGSANLAFTHSFNNGGSDSIKNWDTSKVTNFSQMFLYNSYFNQPIGSWNVSSASNFQYMLAFSRDFNQPLNTWNTSNVTNMFGMFQSSSTFNQPLSNWNTSKVTDMTQMFYLTHTFNQDIGSWDVGKVTSFSYMFGGFNSSRTHSFNNGGSDSIKNWNTVSASNMSGMFYGAPQFNQPIGNWDVSNVTSMNAMLGIFYGGTTGSFNQPLNNWNTSKVNNMQYLFAGQTNFNQNIGSWDTSNVTTMLHMFNHPSSMVRDGVFNNGNDPSIKNWNTSKLKTAEYMFLGQPYFNQEIGLWDVSALTSSIGMLSTNIASKFSASQFNNSGSNSIRNWNTINLVNANQMFSNASAFTQPLGGWKITSMSSAASFMFGKTFNDYSTSSYDDTLIGWASQPAKPNVSINFGTIRYSSAASASRAILTSPPNSWTIVDGGQI
jgi:surface protein